MNDIARDPIDVRLLNDWQRDLPLVPRPFSILAEYLDTTEDDVIARLTRLHRSGLISRIGGVVRPNVVGASTLAAMSIPDLQIEEIAGIVGAEPGVNHSYLRENDYNLWFVATGPDRAHITNLLARIEKRTGLRVLDLRLERAYYIDLGFPLDGHATKHHQVDDPHSTRSGFERQHGDARLLQALTAGLPLSRYPFRAICEELGRSEASVIARLRDLSAAGVLKRFGVIVRHRALGWRSNAMVVWDVDPDDVDRAGTVLADVPGINLCYRRTRIEPNWPYNLYCMVHAKAREDAFKVIADATKAADLTTCQRQILFSNRCFKQTGAILTAPQEAA